MDQLKSWSSLQTTYKISSTDHDIPITDSGLTSDKEEYLWKSYFFTDLFLI